MHTETTETKPQPLRLMRCALCERTVRRRRSDQKFCSRRCKETMAKRRQREAERKAERPRRIDAGARVGSATEQPRIRNYRYRRTCPYWW